MSEQQMQTTTELGEFELTVVYATQVLALVFDIAEEV